jgi:hypothetical protein
VLVGQIEEEGGEITSYVRTDGLLVTARNIGRLEAHVTDFGIALPDTVANMWPKARRAGAAPPKERSFRIGDDADTFRVSGSMKGLDYEFPLRLAPGESASWWLPLKATKETTIGAGIGLPVVRGAVITGSGKRVVSETSVDLAEPETSYDKRGQLVPETEEFVGQRGAQAARPSKKRRQAPPRIDKLISLPLVKDPPSNADEGDFGGKTIEQRQSPDPENE